MSDLIFRKFFDAVASKEAKRSSSVRIGVNWYYFVYFVPLDGSQTRAHRGGEFVSYQKRRADETTNFLFLSDKKGNIVEISEPISGKHHDLYQIQTHFDQTLSDLQDAHIQVEGLFMNADAGFDFEGFRTHCMRWDIMPNIDLNSPNGTKTDRWEYFELLLYQDRKVIEHAFAWQDAFQSITDSI